MTEPEEPTFSVIVLSFTRSADDAGFVRALSDAFRIDAEDAKGIIKGVPLRVKRGADRAATRQLAGQLLGLGAELCVQNEEAGTEKLYYPGSGYSDDDLATAPVSSRKQGERADAGPKRPVEAGPTSKRTADAGASMRDALRQARERARGGDEGAPTSIRKPSAAPPPETAPPTSAPAPASMPTSSSSPPSAPVPASAPLLPLTPAHIPLPRRPSADRARREEDDVASSRRRKIGILAAIGAALALAAGSFAFTQLGGPSGIVVSVDGDTWTTSLPSGAILGEAFAASLLTDLGAARLTVHSAQGSAGIKNYALGRVSFTSKPTLDPARIDKLIQRALDEMAPGAKLGAMEPFTQGKRSGRQGRFGGASGTPPIGRVRAFPFASGDVAILVIVGASDPSLDAPDATAWLDSLSAPD